jgi:hypothetical protein
MSRIFKTVTFNRWIRKLRLSDDVLLKAVLEMSKGLIDAELGSGLYKKRIALPGQGKRGGARTLLATNRKDRWFFLFGFQKNERDNISDKELEALQELAANFLNYSDHELDMALREGEILEIIYDKA